MTNLRMRIGENLGNILLEIAQEKIVRNTAPIFTYQLRQMDEVKLHEIFSI